LKIEKISTGYVPRKLQSFLHGIIRRFNVLVCHRRFGKTVWAVNETIDRALNNPLRNPRYAYIAPTYKQAKKIAWQYFLDYTRFLPNVNPNKGELCIYIDRPERVCPVSSNKDPDHIEIMLLGADDPDTIRGLYLDGCIIDEFAQCDPIIWGQVTRPALADRKKIARDMGVIEDMGGVPLEPWAIFIGTPKGQNHFYYRYQKAKGRQEFCEEYEKNHNVEKDAKMWEAWEKKNGITDDISEVEGKKIIAGWKTQTQERYKEWRKYVVGKSWYTVVFKASETGILDQDEIDEMREDMSEEEVDQELECSFTAAVLGSFYGHLLNDAKKEDRITEIPYNPKYPVDTHWDIGISDKTAIWFYQKIGVRAVHYIDYYETSGKGIEAIKRVLDAKSGGKGTKVEVEPAEFIAGEGYRYGRHVWPHDGGAREFGSGQTRQKTAQDLGLIVKVDNKWAEEDQIDAGRNRLKISYFDNKKCARGLECLYNYQKEWDDKLLTFKKKPKHDWTSHGAKAFGYSALDDRPSYFPDDYYRDRNRQTHADSGYDELS